MKRLPDEREGSFVETVVPSDQSLRRLDQYLSETDLPVTRSRIQRWIRDGGVSVNSVVVRKCGHKVAEGDIVTVTVPGVAPSRAEPESIPLDIIFEDDALVVVNKAAGMVVHPAAGHARSTLVNALLHHCKCLKQFEDPIRPGIVHRLDKDTSGLMIVAKREDAHALLSRQLAERRVRRGYTGLVWGCPAESSGTVDAPIGRHPRHRQRMAVVETDRGRRAVTHFRVRSVMEDGTLLSLDLETGRIRSGSTWPIWAIPSLEILFTVDGSSGWPESCPNAAPG
ncbi:MAG: RluA family pseudouridine synthase [Gemmatimonadetes bacterium]|nr:RluA family pseudouridine synthase [Gemmatimonadota bacterium]